MENSILDKGVNDCTGCSACALVCPTKAISMNVNEHGFYVPKLENELCINCGRCKKVCYKYLKCKENEKSDYEGKPVIGVINNYFEQLHVVSTVGIATQLARKFFEKGYNVVGVDFDPKNNLCFHKIAKNSEEIKSFTGSKYLQSQNYEAFKQVLEYSGKSIVFGTPCQIHGLRCILREKKVEENFILIDLFCAGVPTLNLWKAYIIFLKNNFNLGEVENVNFRDKASGWHKFSIKIETTYSNYRQNLFNDLFYAFYLKKTCLNKACYECLFRHDIASSDIRLGDFWGEKYKIYDDGVGLMLLLSQKGINSWNEIQSHFTYENCTTKDVYKSQKILKIPIPNCYDKIIEDLAKGEKLEDINTKFKINQIGYRKSKAESNS